jgi:NTE family protein
VQLLAACLALVSSSGGGAQGAPPVPLERPKIVLVLGGDGAYGLANVGVLAALEELQIPVDLVVGSGTGALIGGLYAAGNTGAQLRWSLSSLDWDEALLDRTPRDHLTYRRKVDNREFLVDLSLGLGHSGLTLPRSVFAAKRWTLFVETLALPGILAPTFDDLAIPFRAVATDLETGRPVVLDKGELASALRASAALPGLLPPVEIDGRLLSDGTLSDALPIDVALTLGADVVIAVDPAPPLAKKGAISSYLDVGEQILRLHEEQSRKERLQALRPHDVHLELPLTERSLLSHAAAVRIAEEGRVAVLAQKDALASLALSSDAWCAHLAARSARMRPWPVLDGVHIASSAPASPAIVRGRIHSPVGEKLDPARLDGDFARIFGLDLYDDVGFRLDTTDKPDGTADLVVDTKAKSTGPWSLRFGASSQADLSGGNGITLGALLVMRPVNESDAEWRTRVEFGTSAKVETEFIQPLGAGSPFFVAPRLGFERERVAQTVGTDTLAEFDVTTFGAGLDLGYLVADWGELRAGIFHESGRNTLAVGDPNQFSSENFDQGGVEGSVSYDTLDSTAFPRRGSIGKSQFQANLAALGGQEDSEFMTFEHDTAISWKANTLVLGGEFDTTLQDNSAVQNQFPLGGFLKLSGLAPNEIAGSHALVARMLGYHHFGFREGWRAPVSFYLGGTLEAGNVYASRSDITLSSLRMAGSIFGGIDSFLGPIFFGTGITEGGETNVFIILGSIF